MVTPVAASLKEAGKGTTKMTRKKHKTTVKVIYIYKLFSGWLSNIFLSSPLPGEMIQFDEYFFRWVETTNELCKGGGTNWRFHI